jgi:hypothetical protein
MYGIASAIDLPSPEKDKIEKQHRVEKTESCLRCWRRLSKTMFMSSSRQIIRELALI